MSKRGRPTVAVKLETRVSVRVPPDLADAMFLLAHRRRTDVSTLTRRYWVRLVELSSDEKYACREPEAVSN